MARSAAPARVHSARRGARTVSIGVSVVATVAGLRCRVGLPMLVPMTIQFEYTSLPTAA